VSDSLEQLRENLERTDLMLAELQGMPRSHFRSRFNLQRRIDQAEEDAQALALQAADEQRRLIDELSAVPALARSAHELARLQISRHGMDRYPDVPAQLLRLMAELGELAEEIANHHRPLEGVADRIRREYAGVGLSYYELGNKLHLDAIECMTEVVDGDGRRFSDDSGQP
jgi:NTP pyrophosphatase (non-canonical NTP hydrolase)